jgi:transcriptional repressor NrdR
MVCIYCGSDTQVANSRLQKKVNQVWRRRRCLTCQAVFTTNETVDATQALRIYRNGQYEPFLRDTLLLSLYDSLRHRKSAVSDATALTATIIAKLYPMVRDATLERNQIADVTSEVLNRFDKVAATHYRAFHP